MQDNDTPVSPLEEVYEGTAIGQLARAEIDMQISTAKAFPRSLANFKQTALKMATLDEETAASCFYSLPRGGKQIIGPSARLAEIVAVAWKNLRFGARVVSTDAKMLTAQGICHDLESNIAITIEVQRRITDKSGKRFNDDMIVVTGNAASSIALRNAVLKVVPKAYWSSIFDQARQVAVGNAKTLVTKRVQAVEYLQKMGVLLPQILGVLERKAIEEIDLDDLEKLRGLITAIKEGDTTIEEAFAPPAPSAADKVKDRLNGAANTANGTAKATSEVKPETNGATATQEQDQPKKESPGRTDVVKAIIREAKLMGVPMPEVLKPYEKSTPEELSRTEAQEALDNLRGGPVEALADIPERAI